MIRQRKVFQAYLYHTSWAQLSFGVSIDVAQPNIEILLPFCFIRIGWVGAFNVIGWKCGRGSRTINGVIYLHNFKMGWTE
jgi:hypothetical protein